MPRANVEIIAFPPYIILLFYSICPLSKGFTIFLYTLRRRNVDIITLKISAIGNAVHTPFTLFIAFERKYATGSMTKSCLAMDTIILYTPFPTAWNIPEHVTENPANINAVLVTSLTAGIPMDSISSVASNILSICPGDACMITRQNSIMEQPTITPSFIVLFILSGLCAP